MMLAVLFVVMILMLGASFVIRLIGTSGASVIKRVIANASDRLSKFMCAGLPGYIRV